MRGRRRYRRGHGPIRNLTPVALRSWTADVPARPRSTGQVIDRGVVVDLHPQEPHEPSRIRTRPRTARQPAIAATGRAVQNLQGPQSTRIEFKQQVLGAAIEAANMMTLAMQEKAPLLKEFEGQ